MENNTTCTLNEKELLLRLTPSDTLLWATSSLSHPSVLIGKCVTKKFQGIWHCGKITNADSDCATGDTLWEITYHDGDIEDDNLQELHPLLTPRTKPARKRSQLQHNVLMTAIQQCKQKLNGCEEQQLNGVGN